MRIQHNIMAMNAYRNYNTNTSALSKNLEKLSSGYKINRAGDDAAGLAISEKMRAQITGLGTAQKNVKDGISLVKTAEGAMQEVQDMLNRMVDLATQSANGTYQDEVDREALQAEIDQLNSEINRIADSANFNGIKLLDGSLDGGGKSVKVDGMDRILAQGGTTVADVGTKTILDGGTEVKDQNTVFEVDFTGLTAAGNGPATADVTPEVKAANPGAADAKATAEVALKFDKDNVQTINVGDKVFKINPAGKTASAATVTFSGTGTAADPFTYTRTGNETDEEIVAGIAAALSGGVSISGTNFDVAAEGTSLKFTAKANGIVQIDGNDATEDTFTAAVKDAVTSSVESTDSKEDPAPSTGVDVTATKGTDGKAKVALDFSEAFASITADNQAGGSVTIGGTEYKWGTSDADDNSLGSSTTTVSAIKTALQNKLETAIEAAASDLGSGYAATWEDGKVTYTANSVGATTLNDSITGKVLGVDPAITEGADAAEGGTAVATFKTADLKVGDTIKVGDKSLTLETDHLTSATTLANALKALTPTGFDVTATGNDGNGAVELTLTEATGKEGTNDEATLKAAIGLEKASTSQKPEENDSEVSAAAIPAYDPNQPAVAAAGDKVTFDFKLGGEVLAAGVEVEAGADAKAIGKAVYDAIGDTVTLKDTGADYDVSFDEATGKLTFTLTSDPTSTNIKGNFDWNIDVAEGSKIDGNHTGGTHVVTPGSAANAAEVANTVFRIEKDDITDGTVITFNGERYTLAVGPNSTVKDGKNVVNLKHLDPSKGALTDDQFNDALSQISSTIGGTSGNLIVGFNDTKNGQVHAGLTVKRDVDAEGKRYTSMEDLANLFSITKKTPLNSKGLTLQIGDTSESFNQLKVSIGDIHTEALDIADINIGNQQGAAEAINKIKNAINRVSSIRGTLGATQNRLEHTQNNLSVMAENIQDAESSIRDTDIAEEMMAYTKNNILVQSAQAMLAQANQVPQGVLQLLG